ncbi:Hypothetical protein GbCGDNIH9_0949 [Granulibacter bethesdensis]|uniref:Uncharacterized protein n=1 Tax=Granulibacter bethesdensis TaxID=364410 RepID=A0AAC9P884_9PROT|nr:Hypothetical protein GbCGDNIH9_0949 [Granulibacter bethesdensis]APH61827.1 Hypothetical protein GbCGDNIH8_0949 [Granulibacter bethesdensis]
MIRSGRRFWARMSMQHGKRHAVGRAMRVMGRRFCLPSRKQILLPPLPPCCGRAQSRRCERRAMRWPALRRCRCSARRPRFRHLRWTVFLWHGAACGWCGRWRHCTGCGLACLARWPYYGG